MKHTAGPWVISPYNDMLVLSANGEFGETVICTVHNKKDAKVIETAPELLEALEAVRKHGLIEKDGYETIVRQMNVAISKDKGE